MLERVGRLFARRHRRSPASLSPDAAGDVTVVNIIAASYSGSTWLNLMLGAHPAGFSIGEMFWIPAVGRAFCAFHGDTCPLWSRYRHGALGNPFRRIAALSGRRLLVANNSTGYFEQQKEPGIAARFIHLTRDGREVVASYRRKHPGATIEDGCRWWSEGVRHQLRRLDRQQPGSVLAIRYEDLRAKPANELARICAWLGLAYDERMLAYDRHAEHFLGGNLRTLTEIARSRGLPAPTEPPDTPAELRTPDWGIEGAGRREDRPGDANDATASRSAAEDAAFARLAGALNRELGYDG